MTLFLKLISPDGIMFQGEALSVNLPGENGPFTVLPRHAPIISILTEGYVKWVTADYESRKVALKSGFAEVSDNSVAVCVEMKDDESRTV